MGIAAVVNGNTLSGLYLVERWVLPACIRIEPAPSFRFRSNVLSRLNPISETATCYEHLNGFSKITKLACNHRPSLNKPNVLSFMVLREFIVLF